MIIVAIIFAIVGILTMIFPEKSYRVKSILPGRHKINHNSRYNDPSKYSAAAERLNGAIIIVLAIILFIAYINGFDLTNILNK